MLDDASRRPGSKSAWTTSQWRGARYERYAQNGYTATGRWNETARSAAERLLVRRSGAFGRSARPIRRRLSNDRPLKRTAAGSSCPAGSARTSSSSWATTSAGSTSAPITGASCRARRRTSTSWRRRACCSPTTTPRRAARRAGPTSSPARFPLRTGLTTVGQAGADVGMPGPGLHDRHRAQGAGLRHRAVRQEPPRRPEQVSADAARLRRVLRLPVPPRRHVGPVLVFVPERPGLSATSTARATWCTARRRTRTTRPRCRAGARSASRRSWMKARCRRSRTCRTCRTCTICRSEGQVRHDDLRRGAGQGLRSTSWTRPRRTASRSSSGTTRRACTSGRSSRRSTRR